MADSPGAGRVPPPNPNAAPSIFDVYGSSLKRAPQDYDTLFGEYQDLLRSGNSTPKVNFQQVTPQTVNYNTSVDTGRALGDLRNLSATGGYSDQDIQSLRERGVSPIRSIYSSAQSNLARSKALQGGFSPNYAAVTAKLAREQSAQIATQLNSVNAGIAQSVASNKIAAAPSYASASADESNRVLGANKTNADIVNNANQFNSSGVLDANKTNAASSQNDQARMLDILRGATSLYGTTPGQASTFGSQAIAAQGLQNQNNQANADRASNGQNALLQTIPKPNLLRTRLG